MEARRMRAVDLFEEGRLNKAEIARELDVCHQTVSDWHERYRKGGRDALRAAGRAGRLPKLDQAQLEAIETELVKGARAYGYPNDLWSLKRVTEVIEAVTGVSYHPNHVWRILHDKLRWSCQRPARRAVERDDEAVAHWVKSTWPAIKKAPGAGVR
jgi:transposase